MSDAQQATTAPEPSLTARVVKGAAWVFLGKVIGRTMQLARMIVLARLLTPKDFGLFGIVMLAIATLSTFTQTGFTTALIQRKDGTERFLDTAWTVGVIRAFVLAAILFAIAPAVGWFFDEPRCVPLLRVMCASVVIGGFANIGILYFRKELEFHKQVLYDTTSAFIGLVVGVVLAYQLRSVWALVWSSLAVGLVRVPLSYALHPYRPRPRFNYPQAAELFRFGRWVLGNSTVAYLAMNADRIILGKLLGPGALGTYQVADRVGTLLPTEFMRVTNDVLMPAYAKVQDNKGRLGRAFLQVFGAAISVGGPLTAFIILSAPQLVLTVLGKHWEGAVVPLQILTAGAFLRCVVGVSSPLFVGTGHPHMQFWKSLIRALVMLALVYPLTTRFGVAGTAVAALLSVVALSPLLLLAMRIAHIPMKALLSAAVPGLLLSLAAAAGVLPGKFAVGLPVLSFAAQVLGCGLLTLAAALMLGRCRLGPAALLLRHWHRVVPGTGVAAL